MTEQPPGDHRRREIAVFGLALATLTALMLFLGDGASLFNRPLWVDEWLAVMVASRSTPMGVLGDLGSGADGGASAFHLSLWLLRQVAGPLSAFELRLMSLLCVLGALFLCFVILRRRFPATAAAAGALAVGANALVIEHSYEARFYGPWLLSCAATAWLLARRQSAPTRRNAIALGIVSFILCTIHFYGILTLGLMAAGVVAAHGRGWRAGLALVAPTAAGLLALAVVVPLAIAQRVAYSVPSWLPDFRWGQLRSQLTGLWLTAIPLGSAAVIAVCAAVKAGRSTNGPAAGVAPSAFADAGVVALMSLALMPLALALLSIVGQPSMLPRYSIAAVLAWGPWVAIAAAMGGRWIATAMIVALIPMWFTQYVRLGRAKAVFAAAVHQTAGEYRQARQGAGPLPIVFTSIHVMYPLALPDDGRDDRAAFLEVPDTVFSRLFPDSTPLGQANRGIVLERDLARVHAARFGFPRLLPLAALDSTPRFLLLVVDARLPAGFSNGEHFARVLFPNHRFTRLLPDLGILERQPGELLSK